MKRTKLANLFKIGILFFGITLLLWNCEKEGIITPEKKIFNIIEFEQIEGKITNLIPEVKNNLTNKKSSTNIIFNFDEVIKLVDSLENTKFTIEFNLNNQPENIFYNLVIGESKEGVIYEPLIYKYTINNYSEFKEKLKIDQFKFLGEKEIFTYDKFKDNFYNSKNIVKKISTSCGGEVTLEYDDPGDNGYWWTDWTINRTYFVFEDEGSFIFPKNNCGGGLQSGSTGVIINTNTCPAGQVKNSEGICVEKPCVGDPVLNPEIVSSGKSGKKGGTFGCTRK